MNIAGLVRLQKALERLSSSYRRIKYMKKKLKAYGKTKRKLRIAEAKLRYIANHNDGYMEDWQEAGYLRSEARFALERMKDVDGQRN